MSYDTYRAHNRNEVTNSTEIEVKATYRMTDTDGEIYTQTFTIELPLGEAECLDDDATFRAFQSEIDEEWELTNEQRFELLSLTY